MLGFKCRQAVMQEPRSRHSASSSSTARPSAPLIPAARSRRRRSAPPREALDEAVHHMQNKLASSEDQARPMFLSSRIPSVCSTACILTTPTRTSTSSELVRARWTVMELSTMDKHQLQQAAALVIMLNTHPFRHTSTARSRWPASSRRAAAAAWRSARGPHAPRSSPRARTTATSAAGEDQRHSRGHLSIYLSPYKNTLLLQTIGDGGCQGLLQCQHASSEQRT